MDDMGRVNLASIDGTIIPIPYHFLQHNTCNLSRPSDAYASVNKVIIASDNGVLPIRPRHYLNNAVMLLIEPLVSKF